MGWAIEPANPRAEFSSDSIRFSKSTGFNASNDFGSAVAIFIEVANCIGVIGRRRPTANELGAGGASPFHTLDRVKAEAMPEDLASGMSSRRAEAEAMVIPRRRAVPLLRSTTPKVAAGRLTI